MRDRLRVTRKGTVNTITVNLMNITVTIVTKTTRMSCLFFIYIDKYIDQYGIICICSFFVLERIAKAIMVIIMSKENISYLDNMLALYGNRVFSIRNAPADAVYIGRGRRSIFGNPFPMHCEADGLLIKSKKIHGSASKLKI